MNVKCQACEAVFWVVNDLVGKKGDCPKCGDRFFLSAEEDTPNASAEQTTQVWRTMDPGGVFIGELLERHLRETGKCGEPLLSYCRGGIPVSDSKKMLGVVLFLLLFILSGALVPVGWVYLTKKTIEDWEDAQKAGATPGRMGGTIVVLFLFGILAGLVMPYYILDRFLYSGQVYVGKTPRHYVLFHLPMPVWMPRLQQVELLPASTTSVEITSETSNLVKLTVKSGDEEFEINVPAKTVLSSPMADGLVGRVLHKGVMSNIRALVRKAN